VRRVGYRREREAMEFKGPLCTAVAGFSLHAARRVGSPICQQVLRHK
jgi:hypothetical protein